MKISHPSTIFLCFLTYMIYFLHLFDFHAKLYSIIVAMAAFLPLTCQTVLSADKEQHG